MTWRSVTAAVLTACMVGLANCPAAEDKPVPEASDKEGIGASIEYFPLGAPAGMSQAVIVDGQPLVHTRQLVPVDREGKMVGGDSVDKQVEQVLNNLDAVLKASGSSLGQLVRLNVYAIAPPPTTMTTSNDRIRSFPLNVSGPLSFTHNARAGVRSLSLSQPSFSFTQPKYFILAPPAPPDRKTSFY